MTALPLDMSTPTTHGRNASNARGYQSHQAAWPLTDAGRPMHAGQAGQPPIAGGIARDRHQAAVVPASPLIQHSHGITLPASTRPFGPHAWTLRTCPAGCFTCHNRYGHRAHASRLVGGRRRIKACGGFLPTQSGRQWTGGGNAGTVGITLRSDPAWPLPGILLVGPR